VDIPRRNYDLRFKEAITLFKNKALDYNVSLCRMHKRIFDTIIFVKEPTTLTGIDFDRLTFKPIIVQCANIDADAMLDELKWDIEAGRQVNELKLVYLPLFRGKTLDATGLFLESTKLIRNMNVADRLKHKVLSLAVLIAGKVVSQEVLNQIYNEVKVMSTGNVVLDVAEAYGEKRGIERYKEETALKLLSDNFDMLDIIRYTGNDAGRLKELRDAMAREAS